MMDCERAKELMDEMLADAAGISSKDQAAFHAHLRGCAACRSEFARSRSLRDLLRKYANLSTDTIDLLESHGYAVSDECWPQPQQEYLLSPAEIQTGVARLMKTIGEMDGSKPMPAIVPVRRSRAGWLAGPWARIPVAMAAGLMLALGAGLLCWQSTTRSLLPGPVPIAEGSKDASPAVMGQLAVLDPEGRAGPSHSVCAGHRLAAEDQRLHLRIWGRHELVLEPGTRLALQEDAQHGCVVALTQGQVDIAVARAAGEGPFRILTPQADLTVLGTRFTVTSSFADTRLYVRHGTVQLASRSGQQQAVQAGELFQTDGTLLSQMPADTADTLAAADLVRDPVAAIRQSPWYGERFAPLLYLRDYLAEQKVPVDEMTLLAASAEPWCLQRPEDSGVTIRPYIHRKAGLERAAQWYGYSVEWLQPAGPADAVHAIRQALGSGGLVLAYGLAGRDIIRVSVEDLSDLEGQPWQYRFLGEHQVRRFALCRITKAGPASTRQELANEAMADLRQLLAGQTDGQYLVGQAAIESATDALITGVDVPLDAWLFKGLSGLAALGPACLQQLGHPGMAADMPRQRALYTALAERSHLLFISRAFETTGCAQAEQRSTASDLRQILDQCGR